MSHHIATLSSRSKLRSLIGEWRQKNERIALVPTMGALHEGHLSLVNLAQLHASKTIVSLFVNPKQFGQGEDLELYPRDETGDIEKLDKSGADLVYMPTVPEFYPSGFSTSISVSGISEGLCGGTRPGHFDGVATVVSKFFMQCTPDVAIFGEKDYQQLMVIKRLVTDLEFPVKIIGAPIVREPDGLALSSRNAYLSREERALAPLLYKVLGETAIRLKAGKMMNIETDNVRDRLTKAGFRLDYLELRDSQTLLSLGQLEKNSARLLIAATLGRTRLIDNIDVMR